MKFQDNKMRFSEQFDIVEFEFLRKENETVGRNKRIVKEYFIFSFRTKSKLGKPQQELAVTIKAECYNTRCFLNSKFASQEEWMANVLKEFIMQADYSSLQLDNHKIDANALSVTHHVYYFKCLHFRLKILFDTLWFQAESEEHYKQLKQSI